MTRALTVLLALALVAVGVAAVVLGEADDSPGLQLLGVLLVLGVVVTAGRRRRRAGAAVPR